MAVFGVPRVHQDDALRACRAARPDAERRCPSSRVQALIGSNTGEVVQPEPRSGWRPETPSSPPAGTGGATREILIGQDTLALVRGAVELEAVVTARAEGSHGPSPPYRRLAPSGEPERRHESRFPSGERQLPAPPHSAAHASERSCRWVTLVGDAASAVCRLAAELLTALEIRRRSRRCLSYAEGITVLARRRRHEAARRPPSDPAAAASLRSAARGHRAGDLGRGDRAGPSASCSRRRRRSPAVSR